MGFNTSTGPLGHNLAASAAQEASQAFRLVHQAVHSHHPSSEEDEGEQQREQQGDYPLTLDTEVRGG